MFDLDPGKLIVIGIVALIAIPSKDLPRVMRMIGQLAGKARRMSAEFQGQFMEAMREIEDADLKKEIEETNKSIMSGAKLGGAFDPLAEARKQITSAIEGHQAHPPARPARAPAPAGETAAPPSPAQDELAAREASPPPDDARGADKAAS